MAALYIGLGIAMMSGISVMMQIGTNLNKENNNTKIFSNLKEDNYHDPLPRLDRKIMEILYTYSGADADVCNRVKQNLNSLSYSYQEGPIFDVRTLSKTPSRDPLFSESYLCTLVNTNINHRVLIKKNNDLGTYDLFSCSLEDETFCKFEKNITEKD